MPPTDTKRTWARLDEPIRAAGVRTATRTVATRLREHGWLLATGQCGVWEFAPAVVAGAYSRGGHTRLMRSVPVRSDIGLWFDLPGGRVGTELGGPGSVPHRGCAAGARDTRRLPQALDVSVFAPKLKYLAANAVPVLLHTSSILAKTTDVRVTSTQGGPMNRLIRPTVTTALLVAVVVVWVQLITVSGDGLYIEPTTDALAVAAAVVPRGIVFSLLLIVAAAGLGWWTHWRPFLVLGLPGLVTGALFVFVAAPKSAGSAFVCGLAFSIISLVVLAALAVHARLDQVSRKRDETAPAPGPGPNTP